MKQALVTKGDELAYIIAKTYNPAASFFTEIDIGDLAGLYGFHFKLSLDADIWSNATMLPPGHLNSPFSSGFRLAYNSGTKAAVLSYDYPVLRVVRLIGDDGLQSYKEEIDRDSWGFYSSDSVRFDSLSALSPDFETPFELLDASISSSRVGLVPFVSFDFFKASEVMLACHNELAAKELIRMAPESNKPDAEDVITMVDRKAIKTIRKTFREWFLDGNGKIKNSIHHPDRT